MIDRSFSQPFTRVTVSYITGDMLYLGAEGHAVLLWKRRGSLDLSALHPSQVNIQPSKN